jgi:hypothetical protein
MTDTRLLHFRPLVPPAAMICRSLGNRPVLVIGHWVDALGREVLAEVCTMASTRPLHDLAPAPRAPAFQPFEDDGR